MIPPSAELLAQYQPLTQEAATCRERLKRTLPYEDYRQTQGNYAAACEAISRIEQQFAELRPLIRSARNDAKAEFMWQMAKTLLRPHDVEHIEEQCALFARTVLQIPASLKEKSIGELDGARHDERAKVGNQKDRRSEARRSLEVAKDRGTVVYAGCGTDNEPRKYTHPSCRGHVGSPDDNEPDPLIRRRPERSCLLN